MVPSEAAGGNTVAVFAVGLEPGPGGGSWFAELDEQARGVRGAPCRVVVPYRTWVATDQPFISMSVQLTS